VVHITGTNGKGSTARILTELLMANGLTVGTYTSPNLATVNERLARDGNPSTTTSWPRSSGRWP
jgi:dihydrofolate synthase/folylpolyglutamate synthase